MRPKHPFIVFNSQCDLFHFSIFNLLTYMYSKTAVDLNSVAGSLIGAARLFLVIYLCYNDHWFFFSEPFSRGIAVPEELDQQPDEELSEAVYQPQLTKQPQRNKQRTNKEAAVYESTSDQGTVV